MRQARYRFLLLPLFFVLACAGAFAQSANSDVTGIVTDQTGALVAGARIALTDEATGTTDATLSSSSGLYDFGGLNPAHYDLKVTAKGFETYMLTGIVVNISATARVDVKLTVGVETQTVTITADALAVQADSNLISTLISSQQISEIAVENNNIVSLAALGLGVSSQLPDNNIPIAVSGSYSISVNGLRQNHNVYLIDGGEAYDRGSGGQISIMPAMNGLAEFQVLSSNYPPDYGISSGGTISMSLKSGTQKFHGALWEENRNTDYDANTWLNKMSTPGTPRPVEHFNIYGFNVGGPVFIPKVYNNDRQKTFVFWDEEWRRLQAPGGSNEQPTIATANRPNAANLTAAGLPWAALGSWTGAETLKVPSAIGNTAYLALLTADGLTPGGPFNKNAAGLPIIPANLLDPNAELYLNGPVLPPANLPNGESLESVSLPTNARDDIIRVDQHINDKWQLMGHYIHDTVASNSGLPELGWLWASYNTITSAMTNPANSATIRLSGTITPNMLLEAVINYDGNGIAINNSPSGSKPAGWNVATLMPGFTITRTALPGITGFGGPYYTAEDTGLNPYKNATGDWEPKVDVSYTKGKHAMKVGFSYMKFTKAQFIGGDEQGDYGMSTNSGDGLVDMLMGLPGSYSQLQKATNNHYVNNTLSGYVMDNWHMTPRLSLQLGLRYDALPHAWEQNNHIANFNPAHFVPGNAPTTTNSLNVAANTGWLSSGVLCGPSSPGCTEAAGIKLSSYTGTNFYMNGLDLEGVNGVPIGLVTNDFAHTWQPRIGFSDDLFGDGKTILRGGFGTFAERIQGNDIYGVAGNPPFANDPGFSNTYFSTPGASWQNDSTISPATVPVTSDGLTAMAPANYKAPIVAQYSLGVQREVLPSLIWVVQYVGNAAWHQSSARAINTYPANSDMSMRCNNGDGGDNYPGDMCPAGSLDPVAAKPASISVGQRFNTYPGYNGITDFENATNGSYNGFQTGLRAQNKWGLSGEIDYTWSHSIDIQSNDINNNGNSISDPWNVKYDKGSGQYDRRQILNINYAYKLPTLFKDKGILHTLADGWEIAGTVVDESGNPANPGVSLNYDPIGLNGGYTNRPNVSGKVQYVSHKRTPGVSSVPWFNTGQFSNPTPAWLGGTNNGFGNAHKDAIVGPGRVNFTTSLYKSFAFGERAHFDLRFESFNTFNHTEMNGVSTSLNGGNFGLSTGTYDPRVLQLGGKFVF